MDSQSALLSEYRSVAGEAREHPHRLSLEASRLGTWTLDFVGRKLEVSERFKEILGFERGEPGWDEGWDDLFSWIHESDVERVASELANHLDGLWPFDVECRLLSRQGDRWFRLNGQAEFDAGGRVVQMAGTIEDISAMRQLELSLRESEQRFRAVFDATPEAMVVIAEGGTVIAQNQVFDSFDPADQPFELPEVARAALAEEGRYGPVAGVLRRRDGGSFGVELSGVQLDADRVLHVVRNSQRHIEGLDGLRSELDAAMSHTDAALAGLASSRVGHLRRMAGSMASVEALRDVAADPLRGAAFCELTELLASELEAHHRVIGEDLSRLRGVLAQLVDALSRSK